MSNQEMERRILAIVGKRSPIEGNVLWQTLRRPEREQYHKVMTALLGTKKIVRKIKRDEEGNAKQVEFALPKAGEGLCATEKILQ